MKSIDFEAHFATKEWVDYMFANKGKGYPYYERDEKLNRTVAKWSPETTETVGDELVNRLLDLGEGRLKDMEAAGVDVHVLTLTSPGVEVFNTKDAIAIARSTNNELAEAVNKYPDKFVGYAALAPQDPEEAAKELERCIKELGFKGWKTHSNYGPDKYLDDKKYWPILAKAEELDAPIYLHPAAPAIPQFWKYGFALSGAPFGFGAETSLCMMRMILGGVFDQYPKLKVVLGHLGEALPFLITRIDFPYVKPWFLAEARPPLKKKPSDYLRENVFVTTSGNYFEPAFKCTVDALGIERILLGTDHPYEDQNECMEFIKGLSISQEDKDKVYGLNASQVGITM